MAPTPFPEVPEIRLDPTGSDHHGEAARMRDAGLVVRVVLPGEVRAWTITRHDELEALVKDPRISKDYRNWTAWKKGQIPSDWPLIGMLAVDNMVTADGDHHRHLRRPVSRVLSARTVEAMHSSVAGVAARLLEELPGHAGPDGVVDMRQHYACPLTMTVLCGLVMGIPPEWWPRLRQLVTSIFRTDTSPEEATATERDHVRLLKELIALRTEQPGDDLTSDLIATRGNDPDAMTDTELADTLWVMLTAGHEPTVNLITNATQAMLTHPWQRKLAHGRDDGTWDPVIEEVLRWDAPIGNFMARYPTEDIIVAGVTIPKGDAILAPYSGVNRDPRHHGRDADLFDITRKQKGHLAFGAGPHTCPGALLARMAARVSLSALFNRYPRLTLAAGRDQVEPLASLFSNSARALPVYLARPAKSTGSKPRVWQRSRRGFR